MPLTQRKLTICSLMAIGKTNSQIAKELNVSSHTIKKHVSEIISELGAQNRTHAVYILAKENIIKI